MENETIEIVKELPPAKVMLVALDLGKWDCERSLAELSALAEANHMETAATLVQKKQAPEAGTVLGEGWPRGGWCAPIWALMLPFLTAS